MRTKHVDFGWKVEGFATVSFSKRSQWPLITESSTNHPQGPQIFRDPLCYFPVSTGAHFFHDFPVNRNAERQKENGILFGKRASRN